MKSIILLALSLCSSLAMAGESCVYPSKRDDGGVAYFEDCGVVEGDGLELNGEHAENLAFDINGMACVILAASDAFYLLQDGRSQRVLFFDNGCDYFREGLARGLVKDRMVFIDERLETVLTPGFDLLLPYDYGHAVVCNGPFVEEQHCEHTLLRGGQCGLMDKQGRIVVEAVHAIGDNEVFEHYLNHNSHCPAPPLRSEEAALCHAKRHVANMDHHSAQWKRQEISRQGAVWLVTFVEEGDGDEEFTLILNADSAQWGSLIPESHDEARQRLEP
ncbi:hypothetical protein SAMN03159475_2663 [Pseudomonas sp. NFPP33]|nr:hypothetical protein [Pseudomonas sp. NFPP33]SDA65774.1 hypothetical protein SAMN03159475_2663 [Pseudomonas sp. NFPP33]